MHFIYIVLALGLCVQAQGMAPEHNQLKTYLFLIQEGIESLKKSSIILNATTHEQQNAIDPSLLHLSSSALAEERAPWSILFGYCDQIDTIIKRNKGAFASDFLEQCISAFVQLRALHEKWTLKFQRLWHTHPHSPRRHDLIKKQAEVTQRQSYGMLTVEETHSDDDLIELYQDGIDTDRTFDKNALILRAYKSL